MKTLVRRDVARVVPDEVHALEPVVAATMGTDDVLAALGSRTSGLSSAEAAHRLAREGANAVRSHRARALPVLLRQVRSPLLWLLLVTALASAFVGEATDALIIGVIVALSVGLGFANEYRAERVAEALHSQVRHRVTTWRDGSRASVDVAELVPGDVVELRRGELVPADLRLLDATSLECTESVLTGEADAVPKSAAPVPAGTPVAELASCAFLGTVVSGGTGRGLVIATGPATQLGQVAAGLEETRPPTRFQQGLRSFSVLLVQVAMSLSGVILVINLALHRPFIDAVLFSLAIAVGITPQLLPAVVSTSLAAGTRSLARQRVLVRRLVCIEDLGNIEVLLTDKTGTLTEGSVRYMRALSVTGEASDDVLQLGLLCTEDPSAPDADAGAAPDGGDPLDTALRRSPAAAAVAGHLKSYSVVSSLPFDHDRRMSSVLVRQADRSCALIAKGAPESVLARCERVPGSLGPVLERELAAGHRVLAVATRPVHEVAGAGPSLTRDDEAGLAVQGLLVFLDPPKRDAAEALDRLDRLGVAVKVVTGDHPVVAARVCRDLGLDPGEVVTGAEVEALDDAALVPVVERSAVFARVSPADKRRIVRAQRASGREVAFLGDGVNDALALHAADVGVSVDTATDVAKDAADVLLLDKDLHVLADGVSEGRRIFANTMKYVLMGTSSNVGNMVSAAGASAFLSFLPMLPSQILLNNLLYDASQLTIPTDEVDPEQVERPSRWDVPLIRRFMLVFGPVSSLFDVLTFVVMLRVFSAGPALFRTGWFVESLATQTLVIFVIRTRRVPFFRSRPSVPLLLSALAVVGVGTALPFTPLAEPLGFTALPGKFFLTLAAMVVAYLLLVDVVKRAFFARAVAPAVAAPVPHAHRVRRRVARFTSAGPHRRVRDAGRPSRRTR